MLTVVDDNFKTDEELDLEDFLQSFNYSVDKIREDPAGHTTILITIPHNREYGEKEYYLNYSCDDHELVVQLQRANMSKIIEGMQLDIGIIE